MQLHTAVSWRNMLDIGISVEKGGDFNNSHKIHSIDFRNGH